MSDREENESTKATSKSEVKSDKEERARAQAQLTTIITRYNSLVQTLSAELPPELKSSIAYENAKSLSAAKYSIGVLARKQKKESKNSSKNLTHPCYVTSSFAKYVEALKKDGKLGDLSDPQVSSAIDRIIKKNISSLLVTTLIISCDNYSQPKKEGVVFFVTPSMKKFLDKELDKVQKDRDALIAKEKQEAIALAAEAKKKGEPIPETKERVAFNPANYGSALNNVIASYLRDQEQSTTKKSDLANEDLAADLAVLQEHLKAHNASLRDNRK